MRIIALFLFLLGCGSAGPPLEKPVADPGVLQGDELLQTLSRVRDAGTRSDDPGLNQLLEYSRHRDYLVRVQAIKALSRSSYSQRPEVFPVFVKALDDEHWLVRSFAVKTLGKDGRP